MMGTMVARAPCVFQRLRPHHHRPLIGHRLHLFDRERVNCQGVHLKVHPLMAIRLIIRHIRKEPFGDRMSKVPVQVQLMDLYKQ